VFDYLLRKYACKLGSLPTFYYSMTSFIAVVTGAKLKSKLDFLKLNISIQQETDVTSQNKFETEGGAFPTQIFEPTRFAKQTKSNLLLCMSHTNLLFNLCSVSVIIYFPVILFFHILIWLFILQFSARDVNKVVLCVKDLNSPNFHPSMVSVWVTDSFERKDTERDLLAKLLIDLVKSHGGTLSQAQLIGG
jgi:hypothetical protein